MNRELYICTVSVMVKKRALPLADIELVKLVLPSIKTEDDPVAYKIAAIPPLQFVILEFPVI